MGPIPACAGEPLGLRTGLQASGAYPRLRGGTTLGGRRTGPVSGLSPLARGNLSHLTY